MATESLCLLGGTRLPSFTIAEADDAAVAGHRALRREVFVAEQSLFAGDDGDDVDDDPRTIVLVAHDRAGELLGGVRVSPAVRGDDIGWWQGSRLTVARSARDARGVGAALVRAACARAEQEGALRFDATVQLGRRRFFERLGWELVGPTVAAGQPHVLMRWPIGRIQALVDATKSMLGDLLDGLHPGGLGSGFLGDDGAPVPGSDLVAACDAIVPSLVERDPVWAGWCAVLVNMNDLAAMGATPVGLLDAVAGRTAADVRQVLSGIRAASAAYGVPVLGGHTQVGVPSALSVTALGRAPSPVPGGGGRPGHELRLTADVGGGWRPGYAGQQWDSTSQRTAAELAVMVGAVGVARPAAAKDVSMAGIAGTAGMLAEASGCAVELDVAAVPRPAGAKVGDWLTCFPGFAMLTADSPSAPLPPAGPAASATCGRLVEGEGVTLRWPDGRSTPAVAGAVTGLGRA